MNEEHLLDATKMTDSRENLAAEASELVAEYAASGDVCDALYHGMLGLLDRQAAITERETLHSHPMCAGSDTCPALNRLVGKHIEREAPETSDDSREKLEADVRKWFADDYYDDYYGEDDMNGIVARWLDRQAAIVERYWRGQVAALAAKGDQLADANVGLRQQVGELTAELTKRDKGIARLKRRRDELERALEIDSRIRASQDAAIEEIARQRDEARHDLEQAEATCMGQRREIEELRDKLRRPIRVEDEPIDGSGQGNADGLEPLRRLARELESKFGSDVPMAEYEKLEHDLRECDEQRVEYRDQRDWWASECARLERLNAELRDKLADAIGHAWAIVQSQDLSASDMEGGVAE